jgi:hypothetical protein
VNTIFDVDWIPERSVLGFGDVDASASEKHAVSVFGAEVLLVGSVGIIYG